MNNIYLPINVASDGVKVKFTLEQATETLGGVGGQGHAPVALPSGKTLRPCNHCIGGWVCPRVGRDGYGKSRRHRDSIPDV